jgi:hypothetical protein
MVHMSMPARARLQRLDLIGMAQHSFVEFTTLVPALTPAPPARRRRKAPVTGIVAHLVRCPISLIGPSRK